MLSKLPPTALLFTLLIGLFITLAIAGVLHGPADISLMHIGMILKQLLLNSVNQAVPDWQSSIILNVRLPRVIIALLAGASLALCGLVMQGMFRNPLASPSVLGVSSGASLGAVIAIYFGASLISAWAIPLFAFIGAGASLCIVYRVASTRGQTNVATLLLCGVAISALNVAATSLLLALSLSNWDVARMIIYWTMGGLDGRTWDHVLIILPIVVSGYILLLFYSKQLDLLLLGEQHALSVGVDVRKTRRNLLIISSAMVGASISVVGGIGFIGLVVPHIMRLLLGPAHRHLLPACLLAGAITLLGADLFVNHFFSQQAIPLGVVTAALGAPFFLFLLIKQRFILS
ncbi:FecCD family ABC transporter permease [Psychromonas antarctica]|jgi:iron complex transport system permease protein|uniref:FecCD family ABC transporter permease n=1 Tax=Psychromonas antarctica TaxID=67573 RepID=UPI001EE7B31F|nr:iron chelate uptake ABC transporter family permease subunit [Psychromonas antarctica]MCG6201632.1 iron ABC transporter permease [Psychromonas antarctica]